MCVYVCVSVCVYVCVCVCVRRPIHSNLAQTARFNNYVLQPCDRTMSSIVRMSRRRASGNRVETACLISHSGQQEGVAVCVCVCVCVRVCVCVCVCVLYY